MMAGPYVKRGYVSYTCKLRYHSNSDLKHSQRKIRESIRCDRIIERQWLKPNGYELGVALFSL